MHQDSPGDSPLSISPVSRRRAPARNTGGYVELLRPVEDGGKHAEQNGSLLSEYYHLIARRRLFIFLLALMGGVAALLLSTVVRPVYRARVSVDIQNLNVDFMNLREVATTGQVGPSSGEVYMQTEMKLLQSEALFTRIKSKMQPRAEALDPQRFGGVMGRLEGVIPGYRRPSAHDLLEATAKSVTVKPLGLTRLVEINCDSWDPQFASEFCNALTTEFQQQDREVRWNEAQKVGEWLSRQLADVREQLSKSERDLQAAAQSDGLLLTQQTTSVGEQKLTELQSELMRAQASRVSKEAEYELSKSAAAETLPSVLDDAELRQDHTTLVELRRHLAQLVPPLTDAHPQVQHLKAEIAEVEANLKARRGIVVARMRNEFQSASTREQLLTYAYDTQEKRVGVQLGRESQVSILRKEVDSSQQLYQTLLQRVKEAGFASALQASTIRVVDAAIVPTVAISPRRGQSLIIGFLLGGLVGVILAFIQQRTATVLRSPGEAPSMLKIQEFGVIPTARVGLNQVSTRLLRGRSNRSKGHGSLSLSDDHHNGANTPVELATWKGQASLFAEAYTNATHSILRASKVGRNAKVYVVSSPNAGEGKTTAVCNIAIALAQANRRVLIVDGDMRRPRLHEALGVENGPGFRNLLRDDEELSDTPVAALCRATQVPGLSLLTSGTGQGAPTGLLYSPQLHSILKQLAARFDVVLIDSPPMLHLADARILGGLSDGVILVLRAGITKRDSAQKALATFEHDGVRVIGTILNDFNPQREGFRQYYKSYFAYSSANGDGSSNHPSSNHSSSNHG